MMPHKYAPMKADVRAMRKQAGSSKWAIRLGKLVPCLCSNNCLPYLFQAAFCPFCVFLLRVFVSVYQLAWWTRTMGRERT